MVSKFFIKLIKLFIYLFENFQDTFNLDLYSILRAKRDKNNNIFWININKKAYSKWNIEYKKEKNFEVLHNIAFNYWIRSYSAYLHNKNNFLKYLIYYFYIIFYFLRISIFFFKITLSNILVKEKINYINYTKYSKHEFITFLNNKSYLSILENIKDKYKVSMSFTNIEINYRFNFSLNIIKYNKYKFIAIYKVIKYIKKYPFMAKYYDTLFKSLYIYLVFNKDNIFKNKYTLCSEIYSMVSRSISLASLDYRKDCYYIDHSKFDGLPYETYSLHRKINLKNIDKIFFNKKKLIKAKYKEENKIYRIIIQASDGCGTISSYEYDCYSIIIDSLIESNFKGKLLFKFHPANSKKSIVLKKIYCKYKLGKNKDIFIDFKHREESIEYYARKSNLLISIDYSTSFNQIIDYGTPIIYLNSNKLRVEINHSNSIYKNKNFKMITSKNKLKNELKKVF